MSKDSPSTTGLTLDRAVDEIGVLIEDAISFQVSELESEWALAERYYNGYTDLEEFEGRSNVTKTEVRDAIRNTMPSVMRVLLQSSKPVCYRPSSVKHAAWVEQQAEYVCQLFYACDGYKQLYSACMDAFKLKMGILKAWWEEDPTPEYVKMTKVPFTTIEKLSNEPLIEILDFTEAPNEVEGLADIDLFDVEYIKFKENGSIKVEAIPNYEFFISRNCNSIEHALDIGVHGQQQIISVDEALQMGLDYDGDWLELDQEDPETSDYTESSQERRGYAKDDANDPSSSDVLRHKFLLTEAYIKYDLEDEGRAQIYRFYFGGSSYQYIHHERVQDSPFALVIPIPIPHTAYGHSITDLTVNEQDTSTSLLRAAVDNAHASNDAKFIGDPTKIDFDDLMNPALNAPVRAKMGAQVQIMQVPFTAQGTLSVLQYLDQDVQNKIGITKAAQGLDPDALQSTDKDAVRNTIATSQGQVELMVRNIVETGLIRLFKLLLRLSTQHMEPIQMMQTKGNVIPVNTNFFDPDAIAQPNVGMGTGSPAQKQAALTWVIQKIEAVLQQYGPNNPFTSFSQLYNALEDLLEANGMYNVERYFNIVTPKVEEQWAKAEEQKKQQMMQQQQQNQPMDPSKAFMEVEAQKRRIDELKVISTNRDVERRLELEALIAQEKIDVERDKITQQRHIEIAKLAQTTVNAEALKKEQDTNDVDVSVPKTSAGGSNAGSTKPRLPASGGTPPKRAPNSSAGG